MSAAGQAPPADARATPAAPPRAPLDRTAGLAILVALVAFALVRVQSVDVPWHLATARLAQATGHWPVRNTFSYTFPDHPIYQQYPLFQSALYAVFQLAGWAGLSLLTCAGWAAVFLVFVRWAGPLRAAVPLNLVWMIGLHALQRRMILRPDLFTMLALGAMLLALDAYERGRRRAAIATVPFIHVAWVNSHQLFPLSLLVQGMFVAHLALGRAPRRVLAPAIAALLASAALTLATPLGLEVVHVTSHTAGSLAFMRDQVREFAFIWTMPYEATLALLAGAPAAWALWRCRRRAPRPWFDAGLWLLSLALLLSAVRGLMFFGVISVAVFQRALGRLRDAGEPLLRLPPSSVRPSLLRALRGGAAVVTLVLAANAVSQRWVRPSPALGGTQAGLGRTLGGWADQATAFVRANPPPGRVLNLPWSTGNALIWDVPEQPVFVDPRFESYPRAFLREAFDAYRDDVRLAALISRWQPRWIYAEHFRDDVRARLAALLRPGGGWTPVYVDSDHLILVRDGADTAAYRAAHAIDLSRARPADLLPGPPALRAQQEARFAQLEEALGATAPAAPAGLPNPSPGQEQ